MEMTCFLHHENDTFFTFMEMKKVQEKLKIERTLNGAKNVNAQGFDRAVSGAMV